LIDMRSLLPVCLFVAACSAAPPPAKPLARPAPAAAPAPPAEPDGDPARVSVRVVTTPKKLAIDGAVEEWEGLVPDHATRSHVAVAITGEQVSLAARLDGDAAGGVWLGMATTAPDIMGVGDFSRGGITRDFDCDYQQVDIGEGMVTQGDPNPPEVAAACKALITRHEELVAAQRRRFERVFRITEGGLAELGADGALAPVEGARLVWGKGVLEATLPLAALPRLSEAPLATLFFAAKPASATQPGALPSEDWASLELPLPVSFEPHGELRVAALALAQEKTMIKPAVSYQPGDALHVESIHYPSYGERNTVALRREELYRKVETLGDVEVGMLSAYVTAPVILAGGHATVVWPPKEVPFDVGSRITLERVLSRNGELHLMFHAPNNMTDSYGIEPPLWWVLAVAADGSYRDAVDHDGELYQWAVVDKFANEAFDTFGLRGVVLYDPDTGDMVEKPIGYEITWTWSAEKKLYLPKRKKIKAPRVR
jgi:hypothetical protein